MKLLAAVIAIGTLVLVDLQARAANSAAPERLSGFVQITKELAFVITDPTTANAPEISGYFMLRRDGNWLKLRTETQLPPFRLIPLDPEGK